MFSRTKRTAARNWHAKAMLVDPRKTSITIINGERSDLVEIAFEKSQVTASVELNVDAPVSSDFSSNSEIAAEILGTPVSFVLVDEYVES